MPSKKIPPEILAVIAKLQRQVERAEAKGNYETCHHQILANYMSQYHGAGVTPQNAESGEKETP